MSSYVKFDEENRQIWERNIYQLLCLLYEHGNLVLLGLIVQQIYEYCVWFTHERDDKRHPLNVNDLYHVNTSKEFHDMCSTLLSLRGVATHKSFETYKKRHVFVTLFQSQYFVELLKYCFDDVTMFDELLEMYSRWVYE